MTAVVRGAEEALSAIASMVGARDPFNAALNYGYGVLRSQVRQALLLAGLEPNAGFLHADRPGKPS